MTPWRWLCVTARRTRQAVMTNMSDQPTENEDEEIVDAKAEPRRPVEGEIEAKAGRYFRNARYLISVMLLAGGPWFLYDGYVKYPRHNQEARDKVPPEKEPHSQFDLKLQRAIGWILPPIGL